MNMLKPVKNMTTSFSRSVLGTLLLAFGLFLCSSFQAQAHIDADASKRLETLLETLPSGNLTDRLPNTPEEIGPQLNHFDAVEETQPVIIEAFRDWQRLDAALARTHALTFSGISETLSNGAPQTSARSPKSGIDETASDMPTHAAGLSQTPVLPQRSFRPTALPIGTPFCFLPAERGLVSYPTPPPFAC